jgi:hypothetical protein
MPQPMISHSSTPTCLIPQMNSKVNVQLSLGMLAARIRAHYEKKMVIAKRQTKDVPLFMMTTSVKARF